jgi:hypothetical protein
MRLGGDCLAVPPRLARVAVPCCRRATGARLALDWRGAGAAVAPGAPVGKS